MKRNIFVRFMVWLLTAVLVFNLTGLYWGGFDANAVYGAEIPSGGTISISGSDEEGDVADGVLSMSYSGTNPKTYNLTISMVDMPARTGRRVKIQLAEGLLFTDYSAEHSAFTGQLVGGQVNTVYIPNAEYVNYQAPYETVYAGRRISEVYIDLSHEVTGISWNFTVRADERFRSSGTVSAAVKVIFEESGVQQAELLLDAQISASDFYSSIDPSSIGAENLLEVFLTDIRANFGVYGGPSFFFKPRIEYTCPEGITMRLADVSGNPYLSSAAKANITSYFQLSQTGPNTYVLETKDDRYVYGSRGYLLEPVEYVLNLPDLNAVRTVTAVKRITLADGNVYSFDTERNFVPIAPGQLSGAITYVGHQNQSDCLSSVSGGFIDRSDVSRWTPYCAAEQHVKLARIFMGNAGQVDSPSQMAHFTFDTGRIRPTAVPLIVFDGTTIDSVRVKTTADPSWRTVNISPFTGGNGKTKRFIHVEILGLTEGEYLTELEYETGCVPANTQRGTWLIGDVVDSALASWTGYQDIGTFRLYDKAALSDETGVSALSTGRPRADIHGLHIYSPQTAYINPGTSKTVESIVISRGPNVGSASDMQLYICVPDASRITDITVLQSRKSEDQTQTADLSSYFPSENLEDYREISGSGQAYYRFDLKTVLGADSSVGHNVKPDIPDFRMWDTELRVSYTLKTTSDTPAGVYKYKDNIFIDFENQTSMPASATLTGVPNSMNLQNVRGVLCTNAGEAFLQVYSNVSSVDISAESALKFSHNTNYTVYDPSNPSTILPIGAGSADAVNLRTSLSNGSGVAVAAGNVVLWQPIPKKGENWSDLSSGSQSPAGTASSEVPFSLELLGTVELSPTDAALWNVEYGIGIVPPASFVQGWDSAGGNASRWVSSPTALQLKAVNCIRYTSKAPMPGNYSGHLECGIVVSYADVSDPDLRNALCVIRPTVYRNFSTGDLLLQGIRDGDPAALTIATGKIRGSIFVDADKDGVWDDSELAVDGSSAGPDGEYVIKLYKKADSARESIKTVPADASGYFKFNGISSRSDFEDFYALEITNEKDKGHDFRVQNTALDPAKDMIVTRLPASAAAGRANAFVHESSAAGGFALSAADIDIVPVEADNFSWDAALGGVYNLGVIYSPSKVRYSFGYNPNELTVNTAQGSHVGCGNSTDSLGNITGYYAEVVPADSFTWPGGTPDSDFTFGGWQDADTGILSTESAGASVIAGYDPRSFTAKMEVVPVDYALPWAYVDFSGPSPWNFSGSATFTADISGVLGSEPLPSPSSVNSPAISAQGEYAFAPFADVSLNNFRSYAYTVKQSDFSNARIIYDRSEYRVSFDFSNDGAGNVSVGNLKIHKVKDAGGVAVNVEVAKILFNNRLKPYRVYYNANGGTGSVPTDATAYGHNASVTVLGNTGTLSKTGYTFAGWNTLASGSGTDYAAGSSFNITSNTTLYAKWIPVTYSVTYNGNGNDSGSVPTDATAYGYNASVTVLGNTGTLAKTGYTFGGWNTAANGSGTDYAAGSSFNITSNTTLYAKWVPVTYSVTYSGNGNDSGSVPTDATGYGHNASVTVLGNTGTLSKTGYTFAGWNTLASGSGTDYAAGSSFNITSNTTLYAKWIPVTYSVTYNGNGNDSGSVPTDATAYGYNASVTVLGNTGTLAKTGYTFAGWNTLANGSGTDYAAGSSFNITSNTTLYAKWTINTYTLTYDENGAASGTVPAAPATHNYNDSVTVLGNTGTLARTGYTFGGWNTAANGSGTDYAAGSSFNITANTTLYAKWIINTYTLTYDENGAASGTVPAGLTTHNYNSSVTVLDNTGVLAKPGHTFSNWNSLASGAGTDYPAGSSFNITANTTLYAKWLKLTTYTFNANGGTGTPPASVVQLPSSSFPAPAASLVRAGFTFGGWNTLADGSGTNYSVGDSITVGAADTMLYAKWTANSYTVTYDTNGATGGSVPTDATAYGHNASVTVLGNTGTLAKTGYTFAGWNTLANGNGTDYAAGSSFNITSNTTLYAKWTANSYTVTYDTNGATGGSVPTDATAYGHNASVTVLGNTGTLAKTGYTFAGWNTLANGSGTDYAVGSSFNITADTTLYAKWNPVSPPGGGGTPPGGGGTPPGGGGTPPGGGGTPPGGGGTPPGGGGTPPGGGGTPPGGGTTPPGGGTTPPGGGTTPPGGGTTPPGGGTTPPGGGTTPPGGGTTPPGGGTTPPGGGTTPPGGGTTPPGGGTTPPGGGTTPPGGGTTPPGGGTTPPGGGIDPKPSIEVPETAGPQISGDAEEIEAEGQLKGTGPRNDIPEIERPSLIKRYADAAVRAGRHIVFYARSWWWLLLLLLLLILWYIRRKYKQHREELRTSS